MAAVEGVPVVDARGFLSPGREAEPPSEQLAREIREACATWGFFQLVNHGLDADLLRRQAKACAQFFQLPMDAKQSAARTPENSFGYFNNEYTKNRLDLKEGLDLGLRRRPDLPDEDAANWIEIHGHNRWPPGSGAIRAVLEEYMGLLERAAFKLLEAFCVGLGLAPRALHGLFEGRRHTSFLRLNYYPITPGAPPDALGISPHKDAGFLTILLQDDVPGLEVRHGDRWSLVQPREGALVINVGDMAQVLTNDLYKAVEHRVRASSQRERYSMPFFFNPAYDTLCVPLPATVDAQHPPAYKPFTWLEFRRKRYAGDYADVGEEVQITHYRTRAAPQPASGAPTAGAAAAAAPSVAAPPPAAAAADIASGAVGPATATAGPAAAAGSSGAAASGTARAQAEVEQRLQALRLAEQQQRAAAEPGAGDPQQQVQDDRQPLRHTVQVQ